MSTLIKAVKEAEGATGFVALYAVLCMMAEKIREIEVSLEESKANEEALKDKVRTILDSAGSVDNLNGAQLQEAINHILYPVPPAPDAPAPVAEIPAPDAPAPDAPVVAAEPAPEAQPA